VIWELIKHFSPGEAWGDPDKMSGAQLFTLESIRRVYNYPFKIHAGFATSGHSEASYHYTGEASDFHIEEDLSFYSQVIKMLQILDRLQLSGFIGLGIYPQWNNPGFHLDIRGRYQVTGKHDRWGYIDGKYVGFNYALDYTKRDR